MVTFAMNVGQVRPSERKNEALGKRNLKEDVKDVQFYVQ